MSFKASDCFSQAQNVFLNNSSVFTDAKLLPFLIKAYDDLRLRLISLNAPPIEELSAAIDIAAGDHTELTSPTDMILPIYLEERQDGGGEDDYERMIEKNFEPNIPRVDRLLYWTWRETKIKFRGATTNREVRVYYLKSLPDPTSGSSDIDLENYYKTFLAARMASTAAGYISQEWERATAIQEDANNSLGIILGIITKRRQGMPIRQKSWGWARRNKRRFL